MFSSLLSARYQVLGQEGGCLLPYTWSLIIRKEGLLSLQPIDSTLLPKYLSLPISQPYRHLQFLFRNTGTQPFDLFTCHIKSPFSNSEISSPNFRSVSGRRRARVSVCEYVGNSKLLIYPRSKTLWAEYWYHISARFAICRLCTGNKIWDGDGIKARMVWMMGGIPQNLQPDVRWEFFGIAKSEAGL